MNAALVRVLLFFSLGSMVRLETKPSLAFSETQTHLELLFQDQPFSLVLANRAPAITEVTYYVEASRRVEQADVAVLRRKLDAFKCPAGVRMERMPLTHPDTAFWLRDARIYEIRLMASPIGQSTPQLVGGMLVGLMMCLGALLAALSLFGVIGSDCGEIEEACGEVGVCGNE